MIVVLSGVSGGLLFALARRLANGWVALTAWILWIGAPKNFTWRAAYFSESTTSAAMLVALWALWEWRLHRRTRWLATVAVMVALIGITRPLTGIAFAVPVAILVLVDAVRLRIWKPLAVSLAVSLPVAGIVPLWNAGTLGNWRVTPHGVYTRDYMPYDHLGFGFDSTPPRRPIPPDLAKLNEFYRAVHTAHTLQALPMTMVERIEGLAGGMYGLWWPILLPFTLLGLLGLGPEGRFASWVVVAELAAYAFYAHPPLWTLYYLEIYPILATLGAIGLWRILDALEHGAARALTMAPERSPDAQRSLGALLVALVIAWPTTTAIIAAAKGRVLRQAHFRRFDGVIAGMPDDPAILFVRYMPTHDEHTSFITNAADPDTARVWTAYDQGDEDARLMRLFPGRKAWRYDEATQIATPIFLVESPAAASDSFRTRAP
jgi:4-amino-4-deoxy-L-arabinose transferase-like glycosyltransferase